MSQFIIIAIAGMAAALGVGGIAWVFLRPKPSGGQTTLSSNHPLPTQDSPLGPQQFPVLGSDQRDRLVKQAAAEFEAVVQDGTKQFRADLTATSTLLSDQVKRMTTTIITEELESYRHSLEDLRKQALEVMAGVQAAVEEQRKSLASGLEAEMKTERDRMTALLDTKLADIVSSFVFEVLGNKVDMGAQGSYLFETLEAHKEELKRELNDVV